jgi:DNA-binding PadR family transcriptional regulator
MAAPADGLPRSSFLVLLSIVDQPRHGLAIVDRVEEVSHGEVRLGPGTLYGTLQKLVAGGLIRETTEAPDPADHDPRRRYYRLTPRGSRALKDETARMRALVRAAVAQDVLADL